jgi:PKD repeat protein
MKKDFSFIFIFLFLLFPTLNLKSQTLEIIISEVLHGIKEDNKEYKSCEFIELYNPSLNEVNLKELIGEKIQIITSKGSTTTRLLSYNKTLIKKNGYFLIVSKECASTTDFFQLYSLADATCSGYLNENGGIRIIKSNGELIDEVLLENKIGLNQSLERDIQTNEFFIQNCPNPTNSEGKTFNFCLQIDNSSSTLTPTSSEPNLNFSQTLSQPSFFENFQISPSDIVINEFVPDPVDGEEEWVELYNNTEREIDLTGFYIEEGSGAKTFLNGKIPSKGFFVIEKIKGYLNNSGDIIFLKDPSGRIIDKVVYGDWDDGNLADNAPTAKDPYSIARIFNGKDTNEDNLDFKVARPTKGAPNQILNTENFVSGIVINEILPNPKGDDSEKEFIELKNLNNFDVELVNWYLQDSSNRKFKISSKIPKNGFLVIFRKDSKITLNNSGDCVKLFQPDGTLVDSVCYSGKALENVSFARNEKGEFEWTEILTPGKENEIKKPNQKPKAQISVEKEKILVGEEIFFDGSDSLDPDGDNLKFLWDFEDGTKKEGSYVSHSFSKPKKYKVTLKVEDERGAFDTTNIKIEVIKREKEQDYSGEFFNKLFISEIFPNPKGKDDQEFIEIFNPFDEEIDISNFILRNKTKREFKIKEGTKIPPKGFLVFWKKETKISLNNNGDEIEVLDLNKNLIDRVFYSKAPEGFSLARKENGELVWTKIVTPGKSNEFLKESDKEIEKEKEKESFLIKEVKIEEIKNLSPKEKVKTKGIVSVEPGIFKENIFYLAGSGVKVKLNFKEIPKIKIGDELEILGEIFEEEGEKRIEVTSNNDIKILEHKNPPTPKELNIEEINENFLSSLIEIKGKITEIKDNFLWLRGNEKEVPIFLIEEIKNNKKLNKEDIIKVAGILRKISNQFIVFPRKIDDIELIEKPSLKSSLEESTFQKDSKLVFIGILITLLITTLIFIFKKKKLFSKK